MSPGRKVDPNPTLDVERLRALILGRSDPAEAETVARSHALEGVVRRQVSTVTPGDTLSLRAWPSFNPNVIGRIPDATALEVLAFGEFDRRQWLKVAYGGREGWIVASYTAETEVA